jgi:hypothetical protein
LFSMARTTRTLQNMIAHSFGELSHGFHSRSTPSPAWRFVSKSRTWAG